NCIIPVFSWFINSERLRYLSPDPRFTGKHFSLKERAASHKGACKPSFILNTSGSFLSSVIQTGTATVVRGKPSNVHITVPEGSSPFFVPVIQIAEAEELRGMKSSKFTNFSDLLSRGISSQRFVFVREW